MRADFRTSLVSFLNPLWQAQYPDVPLVFDNAPFDWNNPPERFVTVELQFYAAHQIGMSATPKTRHSGFVYVTSYAKAGSGAGKCLEHLDWVSQTLGYTRIDALQFQTPAAVGSKESKGWYMEEMKIAFYADET